MKPIISVSYPVFTLGLDNFISTTSGIFNHFFLPFFFPPFPPRRYLPSLLGCQAIRQLDSPLKQVGTLQQREDEQPVPKTRGRQVTLTGWNLTLSGVALGHLTELECSGRWNACLSCLEGTGKSRMCSWTVVFSREEVKNWSGQVWKFDLDPSFSPFDWVMKFNSKKILLLVRKQFYCAAGLCLISFYLIAKLSYVITMEIWRVFWMSFFPYCVGKGRNFWW